MSCRLAYMFDEALASYDFGRGHPLSPIRQRLTNMLVEDFNLLELDNVALVTHIKPVRGPVLRKVHSDEYIGSVIDLYPAVRRALVSDNPTLVHDRGRGQSRDSYLRYRHDHHAAN